MENLKYLVSKDSKGKIRIVIVNYEWNEFQHAFLIHRTTGQYEGKLTNQPDKIITKGKAKRTITEQVKLEYNALIKKYKDKGYKELEKDIKEYTKEELITLVGEVITNQFGVPKPMLAKKLSDVTNKKIFDKVWWASPKIDG